MIDIDRFLSRAAGTMQESAIRKMGALGVRVPDLISFAPGFPAPDVFAWDEFRDIARTVLDGSDASVLQYGPTRGYRPLVAALPEILAERGIARHRSKSSSRPDRSRRSICAPASSSIPGDVVLVELPTYAGAITAFRNAQARLVGVRQDADGIDLEDLDRALDSERAAGRRIAFLYVVPNFQNPTGLLISLEKRRGCSNGRRAATSSSWRTIRTVPCISAMWRRASDTRPIKADDADGRVVYLSSFSKTVAPGFRVAWIAAAEPLVAKIEVAKQAADLCTGGLDQRIVYEVWKRGVLAARLPMLREHYQAKRRAMERALARELNGLVTWPAPKGGFFLWASFGEGIDTDAMLARAIAHSVVYVAGSAFFVDGRSSPLRGCRFPRRPISGSKRASGGSPWRCARNSRLGFRNRHGCNVRQRHDRNDRRLAGARERGHRRRLSRCPRHEDQERLAVGPPPTRRGAPRDHRLRAHRPPVCRPSCCKRPPSAQIPVTITTSAARSGPRVGRSGSAVFHRCAARFEIERAQHVVERHEIDVVLVARRHADDVAAGAPPPVDGAVLRHAGSRRSCRSSPTYSRSSSARMSFAAPPSVRSQIGSPSSTRSATMRPSSVGM